MKIILPLIAELLKNLSIEYWEDILVSAWGEQNKKRFVQSQAAVYNHVIVWLYGRYWICIQL